VNGRHVSMGAAALAAVVSGGLWLSQGPAEARALPVAPVHAHTAKPDPKHDCGSYRFTAKVPTTEVGPDGAAHAGVSIQMKWGDPHWVDADGRHTFRTGKPGYWESRRACLAGTGTATPKPGAKVTRVKVVGYFDPCAVDGSGDIFYGIAHDLVDDDRALDGRVRHQKVRIHVPASVLARCAR
jgi:hypothetical protein